MKVTDQTYDITISFFSPTYSIPKNTTLNLFKKKISGINKTLIVDFWAIGANKADPKQSILKALQHKAKNFDKRLQNAKAKPEKKTNEIAKLSESAAFFNFAVRAISEGRILDPRNIDAKTIERFQDTLNQHIKPWVTDISKSVVMFYKTPLNQYIQEKVKVK